MNKLADLPETLRNALIGAAATGGLAGAGSYAFEPEPTEPGQTRASRALNRATVGGGLGLLGGTGYSALKDLLRSGNMFDQAGVPNLAEVAPKATLARSILHGGPADLNPALVGGLVSAPLSALRQGGWMGAATEKLKELIGKGKDDKGITDFEGLKNMGNKLLGRSSRIFAPSEAAKYDYMNAVQNAVGIDPLKNVLNASTEKGLGLMRDSLTGGLRAVKPSGEAVKSVAALEALTKALQVPAVNELSFPQRVWNKLYDKVTGFRPTDTNLRSAAMPEAYKGQLPKGIFARLARPQQGVDVLPSPIGRASTVAEKLLFGRVPKNVIGSSLGRGALTGVAAGGASLLADQLLKQVQLNQITPEQYQNYMKFLNTPKQ